MKNDKKLVYVGKGGAIMDIPAMDLELTKENLDRYAKVLNCKPSEVEEKLINTKLYEKAGK